MCIISNFANYSIFSEILTNFAEILINYKTKKNYFPEQLRYILYKEEKKTYTVIKENNLFEFYFSFLMNKLKIEKKRKSMQLAYPNNSFGKKTLFKFNLNCKDGYFSPNFDLSIIFDYFNVDDIIKIYLAMLMEFKIIFIFDDYNTINEIIFSFVHLLFPLKWNYPIVSFINRSLLDMLEAPFGIILGVPIEFIKDVNLICLINLLG